MATKPPPPIPAESLIPHRAPMLFIETLVAHEPGVARATACFPPGHYGERGGRATEPALFECVAQTMAALKEAEAARRFAAQTIDAGESTLAAYRRVIAPPPTSAAIVDERG